MKWKSNPLLDEPLYKTLALLFIIIVVVSYFAYELGGLAAYISLVLLLISLSKYFLPTVFEVSTDGIRVKFFIFDNTYKWSKYKRYRAHQKGIFLAPLDIPSGLDSFKGMFLPVQDKFLLNDLVNFVSTQVGRV